MRTPHPRDHDRGHRENAQNRAFPHSGRAGFTLLEVVIVMVIGGILASVAFGGFGDVQARMGVRSAESNFLSMHAQTRAFAVERGIAVELAASSGDGTVTIREGCGGAGTALQERDFTSEFGTALDTGDGGLSLCMTPRGYASPSNNSFADEGEIVFTRGDHQRTVRLLPLGQAVRP